jgi:hypothetical protein
VVYSLILAEIAGEWKLVFFLPSTTAYLLSASLEHLSQSGIARVHLTPEVKCDSQHSNLDIHVRLPYPHSKGCKKDKEERYGDGAKDVGVAALL